MAHYARVIFPRDPANNRRLLTPEVARAIDDMPLLEPRVTDRSVTLDVEMLPDEELSTAATPLASRALEKIRDIRPWFDPPDEPQ